MRRWWIIGGAAAAVLAGTAAAGVAFSGGATPAGPPPGPAATALALTGDLHTHDPALVVGEAGQPWYVFSTGDIREGLGSPQIRRSTDGGRTWTYLGTVWDAEHRPAWLAEAVPGVQNVWAPEVYHHDGTYYLYYAASTFGSNRSVIGLMTSPTLDPAAAGYGWTDRGEVWRSVPGETNYNAIDPAVVEDDGGRPWLAFGSFWSGLKMIELSWPSGMPADRKAEPVGLARRITSPGAVEAPSILRHDGWYYLFFSRDFCCRGTDSTYNIAVGRSRTVTGPYTDRAGKALTMGGGTPVLDSRGDMVGPGGQSVTGDYLAFHYYAQSLGGDFRLAIRRLAWDADGWPIASTAAELDAEGRPGAG